MQIILTILTGVLIIIAVDHIVVKPVVRGAQVAAPRVAEGMELVFGLLLIGGALLIGCLRRFPILLAPVIIAAVWALFAFVLPTLPKGPHEYIPGDAPRAELVKLPDK